MNTQASEHCSGPGKLADTKLIYRVIAWYVPPLSLQTDNTCVQQTSLRCYINGWVHSCGQIYFCPTKCIDLVAICCRYASKGAIKYRNKLTYLHMLTCHRNTALEPMQIPYNFSVPYCGLTENTKQILLISANIHSNQEFYSCVHLLW
jgi:hypothetical protein